MKHIEVNNIDKLRKGELTDVLEVVDDERLTKTPNGWVYVGMGTHKQWLNFEKCDMNFVTISVDIPKHLYIGKTVKAYEPHKNKLLNWLNKLNGVKVKVVGIDSKQIKDVTKQDICNAFGISTTSRYITIERNGRYCEWHEPEYAMQLKLDAKSKEDHCIIYKLETV